MAPNANVRTASRPDGRDARPTIGREVRTASRPDGRDARPTIGRDDEERVDALFARLTQDEKLSLLSGTGFTTRAVPRLGIPAMGMVDGPRGVRGGQMQNYGPSTQFLEPIAMAATWNPALIDSVGASIGLETRNKGIGAQVILGPCVNIERSPLWGRAGESFGEDPYLTSRMAVDYIKGVQSRGVAACIKHYACNNEEGDRNYVDALVDERALREIYLPAFEAGVKEGHVWTLMAAYNKINGYYATENQYLMTDVLRGEWGFDGLAMSDWGATHSTIGAVNAGLDLEMPGGDFLTKDKLADALKNGKITQAEVDTSVKRILRTVVRTGLMGSRRKPDHSKVDTPQTRRINYQAACESMVLLKNDRAALPLERGRVRSIAVVGPLADANNSGIGGSSYVASTYFITPLTGLKKAAAGKVALRYAAGCGIAGPAERFPRVIPSTVFKPAHGEAAHGLTGEYFTSQDLSGKPALVRTDPDVDFDWSSGPAPKFQREHYSVRWTGTLIAPKTGRYEMGVNSDDGVRVFVDDKPVIDHWADGGGDTTFAASVDLVAGRAYKFRVEYYQNEGGASIRLAWLLPGEFVPGVREAVQAAAKSDAAVVFVGTSGDIEGEGFDRSTMALPGDQEALIDAVAAVNKRTIVVVASGGPVEMASWAPKVRAIVQSWNAGQETGHAVASILFGDVDPSGKLPMTIGRRRQDYCDYGHFPGDHARVKYAEGIFVGYRHFDHARVAPLYPFGYGLSYTTFRYHDLRMSTSPPAPLLQQRSTALSARGKLTVTVDITNTGRREGKEIVELYLHDTSPKVPKAVRELKGFAKVDLAPGQTKPVSFTIMPDALAYVDPAHKCRRADAGAYDAEIGASSRDIRLTGRFRLTQAYVQSIPDMQNGPVVLDEGLAAGRPATASSTQGDLVPGNAVDGDPSTRWGSDFADPQWLAVDLGRAKTVGRVKIVWEDAYASAYEVQVSVDGKDWRTVYSTQNGHGGVEEARFTPVSARWVRLYCVKRSTQWGDSLFSFGVFGK